MIKKTLSDTSIRATKPTNKDIRLFDSNGLYLIIKPNDSRWWRIDYSINRKRKTLSLGTYPLTSLADARKKAFDLKKLVAQGVDPSEVRKETKKEHIQLQLNDERINNGLTPIDSFKYVADEWFNKRMQHMTDGYKSRIYSQLKRDVYPYIGNKHISEVTAKELLVIILEVEHRGAVETAHRTLRTCSQVFRYGVVTGRPCTDITTSLKGALKSVKNGHFSAITDIKTLKQLLISIDSFTGSKIVHSALSIAPHVFVRPV